MTTVKIHARILKTAEPTRPTRRAVDVACAAAGLAGGFLLLLCGLTLCCVERAEHRELGSVWVLVLFFLAAAAGAHFLDRAARPR